MSILSFIIGSILCFIAGVLVSPMPLLRVIAVFAVYTIGFIMINESGVLNFS